MVESDDLCAEKTCDKKAIIMLADKGYCVEDYKKRNDGRI